MTFGGLHDANFSLSLDLYTTVGDGLQPHLVSYSTSRPKSDAAHPFCQKILIEKIHGTRIYIWDVMILIPNVLFLAFLLWRLRSNVGRLRTSSSPIFTVFYALVCLVSFISVVRCVASMSISPKYKIGKTTHKILWLVLRFFLLGTEASVIIFGIFFGHLDSRTSVRRVLTCTVFFALVYSTIQGTLELHYSHKPFLSKDNSLKFDLYAHGGTTFLIASSALFCLVYTVVLILPLTRLRERFILPTKRSFYGYVATLAVLNLCQAVGSVLLYQLILDAFCVVDITIYIYFTLFDPLVYATFLWKFFRTPQSSSILFSYKYEEENIPGASRSNLPSQNTSKGEGKPIVSGSFRNGSGHLYRQSSVTASYSPPSRVPTPFLNINSDR